MKSQSTRRDFVLRGGALLGAGVATTTAGAAALGGENVDAAADLRKSGDVAAEREAIRRLHLTLLARVEQQDFVGVAELFASAGDWRSSGSRDAVSMHTAYRQTSAQRLDDIVVSEDGMQASARFHVEAEMCTPIQGDCTAAQMARLQGNVASRHWESGRFEVKYSRVGEQWQIASLLYFNS